MGRIRRKRKYIDKMGKGGGLMLNNYKYTEKEQKELLKSIVILSDTREKKNKHITDFFDEKNIKWKTIKMNQGDYSFYIPMSKELNIGRDIYFDKEVCIERKSNLEELSGNLTNDRNRIKTEFAQCKGDIQLLIESSSYKDLVEGNYNTKYNKTSFTASLHSISNEFKVPFVFIDKEYSGLYIYMHFRYWLRNIIK